jgi:hypothetical protein
MGSSNGIKVLFHRKQLPHFQKKYSDPFVFPYREAVTENLLGGHSLPSTNTNLMST